MYMIKTYVIKIQSQNLIHVNRLLTVPKISFQMILKAKIRNRIIQSKMISIQDQVFEPESGSGSFAEILGLYFMSVFKDSLRRDSKNLKCVTLKYTLFLK